MEFGTIILVFIIGVAVIAIIGASSSDYETPQQKQMKYAQRKSEWESKVVDRNLEIELEDYVYRGNRAEVEKAVLEAYAQMPWKKEIGHICFTPEEVYHYFGRGAFTKKERETIAQSNRTEALRILLAQKGKLRYGDAHFGIANNGFGAPTTKMMHEWNTDSANFALWINEQLKKHGVDEPMYIETSPGVVFRLTEENKFRNGSYIWEPVISPTARRMG